ncbi:MAG: hypothetical protein E4G95_04940 [Bacteroidia bacterium]|nr:MAG: hypothetical protein E4G95_04940 [Bacteroidia bacterium]
MMKQLKLILPVAILARVTVAFQACNQSAPKDNLKSGVEHFRLLQFSETPFDLETGTHQLTAEEAKAINNYKFTYDESGRLASVEYCRGDELLTYGSLGGAVKIVYTYEANQQVKSFFNKAGEQVESGGIYSAVYTLDNNDERTALKFIDKEGNPVENRNNIHRYTWNRLENGLVKELRYNLAEEETVMNPFCPFYELRFDYDSKGYVTNMSNYQADTLYNCTAENCGDIGVSYFKFVNNESGDLLSFSVHNTVGQLSNLYWGWAKRLNTVDQNGYVIETAMYDQDDEYLSGNNVPVTKNIYDEHGALVESWSLDEERSPLNNPNNGVAFTEYRYDNKGNRIETLRFDKDRVAVVTQ